MLKARDTRLGEWIGADPCYPGADLYVERFAPGPATDTAALFEFQGMVRGQERALIAQEGADAKDIMENDIKCLILYALGGEFARHENPLFGMTVAEQRILQELAADRMRRVPAGDSTPSVAGIQLAFACQLYWMAAPLLHTLTEGSPPRTDRETRVASTAILVAQLSRSYMSGGSGHLSAYYPNYMAAVDGYIAAPSPRLVKAFRRAKATLEASRFSSDPAYRAADTLSEARAIAELDGCHNDLDATDYHSLIGVPRPGAEPRVERLTAQWGLDHDVEEEEVVTTTTATTTTTTDTRQVSLPDIEHSNDARMPSTIRLVSVRTDYALPTSTRTTQTFVSASAEAANHFRIGLEAQHAFAGVYNGGRGGRRLDDAHPLHYRANASSYAPRPTWSADNPVLQWRGVVLHHMVREATNWEIVCGFEARAHQLYRAGIRSEERLALMTGAAYNWLAALTLTEDGTRYVDDDLAADPQSLAEEMPVFREEIQVYLLWMMQISVDQTRYASPVVSGDRVPAEDGGFQRSAGVRSERLTRQFRALLEVVASVGVSATDIADAVLIFWSHSTHAAFADTFASAEDVHRLLASLIADPQLRRVTIRASPCKDRRHHVAVTQACATAVLQVCRAVIRKLGDAIFRERLPTVKDFVQERRFLESLLSTTRDARCRALVHAMTTDAMIISADREVSEEALLCGDVHTWQVVFGEMTASYDAFLFFADADTLASAHLVASCMQEAFERMSHAWQVEPVAGMVEAAKEEWEVTRRILAKAAPNPLAVASSSSSSTKRRGDTRPIHRRQLAYATDKFAVLPASDSVTTSLGTEEGEGYVSTNRQTTVPVRQITIGRPTAWLRKSVLDSQLSYARHLEGLHRRCDEAVTNRAARGTYLWADLSDPLEAVMEFSSPRSAASAVSQWTISTTHETKSVGEQRGDNFSILLVGPSELLGNNPTAVHMDGYHLFTLTCAVRFFGKDGQPLGPRCEERVQVQVAGAKKLYACFR